MATIGFSNNFKVTDMARFQTLMDGLGNVSWYERNGLVSFSTEEDTDISLYYDEDEGCYCFIADEIQKILPNGEVCLLFSSSTSSSDLVYLNNSSSVVRITKDNIQVSNIIELANTTLFD